MPREGHTPITCPSTTFHKSKEVGKSERARVDPDIPALYPQIGTTVRLYILITLENGTETYTDLDIGAECNVVSKEFACRNKLPTAPFLSPSLKGVAPERLRTYNVF